MVNLAFACVKSGYDLLPNFKICWWVVHGINSSPFSPVAGTSTVRIMQVVTPPWRRWLSEYSFRVRSALLAITWFSLISLSALAQMEVVEIDTPQFAKSVAGVVNDPSGAALPGVTVEERSEDGKQCSVRPRLMTKAGFASHPTAIKPFITFSSHAPASTGCGLSYSSTKGLNLRSCSRCRLARSAIQVNECKHLCVLKKEPKQ